MTRISTIQKAPFGVKVPLALPASPGWYPMEAQIEPSKGDRTLNDPEIQLISSRGRALCGAHF